MSGMSPDTPAAGATASSLVTPARLRPLWARAWALVISPRSVFEELAERPGWFWTALLISGVALVISYLIFEPVVYPYLLVKLESRNLPGDQLSHMQDLYGSPGFHWFSSLMAAGLNLVMIVLLGLILFGICSFLLGGRARVRQALAVAAHAWLVHVPRTLLVLPVMFSRQDPTVTLGPGAFFPLSEAEGFGARALAGLLAGLDLFNLWSLALCILGMSVVSKLSAKQTAAALVPAYVLAITLASLVGAAFPQ
jgi:hypothetical protein